MADGYGLWWVWSVGMGGSLVCFIRAFFGAF